MNDAKIVKQAGVVGLGASRYLEAQRALLWGCISRPVCDRPPQIKHPVERFRRCRGFDLLGGQIPSANLPADDPLQPGDGALDQAAPVVPGVCLPGSFAVLLSMGDRTITPPEAIERVGPNLFGACSRSDHMGRYRRALV